MGGGVSRDDDADLTREELIVALLVTRTEENAALKQSEALLRALVDRIGDPVDMALRSDQQHTIIALDDGGMPLRMFGSAEDITERKRVEESLKKSERRAVAILESIVDGFFAVDREWRFSYVNPQAERLMGRHSADLLGKSCWEEFPESIGTPFEHECRRAMDERASVIFEALYPPPLSLWVNVHAYPSTDGLSVYITDITERKAAEDALRRSTERLAILHETDKAILAARSPVQIAEAALERLGHNVHFRRASVAMLDLHAREMRIFATVGAAAEEFPAGTRLALDEIGDRDLETLLEGREFVVDDVHNVEPLRGTLVGSPALGVRSYARVPLSTEGQLVGSLNLYSELPSAFDREHVEMAREVADSLAIAIRQAQLFEEVKSSRQSLTELSRRLFRAEEAERRRIAGELHDEIGQALSALKLNLLAINRNPEAPTTNFRLDESIALVERTMEQVRGLSLDLRPALLDDLGLVPALRSTSAGSAAGQTSRSRLPPTSRSTGLTRTSRRHASGSRRRP